MSTLTLLSEIKVKISYRTPSIIARFCWVPTMCSELYQSLRRNDIIYYISYSYPIILYFIDYIKQQAIQSSKSLYVFQMYGEIWIPFKSQNNWGTCQLKGLIKDLSL